MTRQRCHGSDAVDVADLSVANGLLRFCATRDGVALLEEPPGEFLAFRLEAVRFWCDAGPVIRAAYDDDLAPYDERRPRP